MWLAHGLMAAWVIYALGRFALGAAIGRSGVLYEVRGHLPLLRRITAVEVRRLYAMTLRRTSRGELLLRQVGGGKINIQRLARLR